MPRHINPCGKMIFYREHLTLSVPSTCWYYIHSDLYGAVYQERIRSTTNWGKHSVACFRSTENPPWVLVSDAVNILQKDWTVRFGWSGGHGSGLVGSFC